MPQEELRERARLLTLTLYDLLLVVGEVRSRAAVSTWTLSRPGPHGHTPWTDLRDLIGSGRIPQMDQLLQEILAAAEKHDQELLEHVKQEGRAAGGRGFVVRDACKRWGATNPAVRDDLLKRIDDAVNHAYDLDDQLPPKVI